MILIFILGSFVGIIIAPLLELLIALVIANQNKRTRHDTPPIKNTSFPTPAQQIIMDAAYHTCKDVSWLNLGIQRYFVELSRSNAYKSKLIKNMLSKVTIKNRIIKEIRVEKLCLGNECPIIKSITPLKLNEYQELIKNKTSIEKELLEEVKEETKLINKQIKNDNEESYSEEEEYISNDSIVDGDDFQQCYFLIEVYYNGSINYDLKIDLFKGYLIPITGAFNGFESKIVLRLPAKDYNTRFEYTFIGDPCFKIDIQSGLSGDSEQLYMAKTLSSLTRKVFRFTLHSMLVYPNWYTHYLPQVTPSLRAITHEFKPVNAANFSKPIEKLCSDILLYLSMDYKITGVRSGIVFRRINYFINGEDRILCSHFEIPPNAFKNSVRDVTPGTIHLEDITHSTNITRFPTLSTGDAEILGLFYTLRAFHGVFTQFRGLKEIRRLDNNISLVSLHFTDQIYEFVRIIHQDILIFQRNNTALPEFFVFKIYSSQLFVYQYSLSDNLRLNSTRMKKLHDRMSNRSFKTLGSNKLFRFMAYSRSKANSYFGTSNNLSPKKQYDPYALEAINDVFDRLKRGFEDGWINDEEVHRTTVEYATSSERLSLVLGEDDVRMRLFCESCVIGQKVAMNEKIKYFTVEEVSSIAHEYMLYSYKNKEYPEIIIIDTEIDKKGYMQGFVLEDENEHKCSMTVYYNKVRSRPLLANFFFAIEQRMHLMEYFDAVRCVGMVEFVYKKILVREFVCLPGTFYLEFYTGEEEDFYFYLYDKTQCTYIIDKVKVITGGSERPCRFIVNLSDKTNIELSLKAKTYRNRTLYYRVYQEGGCKFEDSLVDCRIGMKKKEKFSRCFIVPKDVTVFWEVGSERDVEVLLGDGESVMGINGNGMVVSKGAAYTISYKNYGDKKRGVKVYFGCAYLK